MEKLNEDQQLDLISEALCFINESLEKAQIEIKDGFGTLLISAIIKTIFSEDFENCRESENIKSDFEQLKPTLMKKKDEFMEYMMSLKETMSLSKKLLSEKDRETKKFAVRQEVFFKELIKFGFAERAKRLAEIQGHNETKH